MGDWTVFSNHGHVLVCLARDNETRLRNVADAVGITERAVQKIVRELQQEGFIAISKHGRCNRYDINTRKALRHDLESKCSIGRLLQLFTAENKRPKNRAAEKAATAGTVPEGLPPDQPRPVSRKSVEVLPVAKQPKEAAIEKKKGAGEAEKAKTSKKPIDDRNQGSLF